jgi:hypothetical protein
MWVKGDDVCNMYHKQSETSQYTRNKGKNGVDGWMDRGVRTNERKQMCGEWRMEVVDIMDNGDGPIIRTASISIPLLTPHQMR